jgi:hypothetical protein
MIFFTPLQKKIFITTVLIMTTTSAESANQKPIANAGADQNVIFSSQVTLSAAKSSDMDGTLKTYQWQQTAGTKVVLKNAKSVIASFTSPKKPSTLVFKLTVIDDKKAMSTDMITVNVSEKLLCELPRISQKNACVDQSTTSQLNDTGITFCSDGAYNVDTCGISSYPRQDAEFGRDFFDNVDKDGHAGFSFTKISATGKELPTDARVWACIKDNVTGLMWEVKTAQNTLHTYAVSETDQFVKTVNAQNVCGQSNWRVPHIQELQSIVDYSVPLPNPNIDVTFFPNTSNQIYWSATPYSKNKADSWGIYFDDGRVYEQDNTSKAALLLVSAKQNASTKKYVVSDDGQEVLDTQTNLIWRRCVEGMNWNGVTCEGSALGVMLQEGLSRALLQAHESAKAWRVPDIKELASLVDYSQSHLAIDSTIFPATPNDQYWSSSPYALDAFYGWVVHFYYGASYYTYLEDTGMLRLVRNIN